VKAVRSVPKTRRAGVALAGVAACISGVAVFVNGYGVRRWGDATAYTTAKNLVAAIVLGFVLLAGTATRSRTAPRARLGRREWAGVGAVALIGGSVPFVLFFEGLARASSTDAAFVQKTLVVWVALLAVPLLHERIGPLHFAAIALLVVGQAALTGGVPHLVTGAGVTMVFAATLLWAVETVFAKWLLGTVPPFALGAARMGGGVVVLLGWLAVRGTLGDLADAGTAAWGWVLLTGVILAAYVGTWYSALARAQAVDVTALLVVGALVTAALDTGIKGVPAPDPVGLVLVATGGLLVAWTSLWRDRVPGSASA